MPTQVVTPQRRRQLTRAAFVAIAGAAALPAFGQNLLVNAGFEAPNEPPSVNSNVAGWTLVNDAQRAHFKNHTPGGVFSIWAKTFQPAGGGIFQEVTNISPGANYNLTSQLYFESAYPTTEAVMQLGLTWFDAAGSQVGTPNFTLIQPSSITTTDVWTPFSVSGTAPTGAAKVRVFLGWDGGGTVTGAQSAFFDDAVLLGPGVPPTSSTWIVNGSGDWNASGNWANGVVPNAVGATAEFFGAITSAQTVFTNTPVTVGTVSFNNANTYVIAGAGSMTLQVATGNARVSVEAGTHKINLPLRIASNTVFNAASGATLKISDPVTVNPGRTITQTGTGVVTYESTVDVQTGAGLQMGSSSRMAALSLGDNANATLTIGGGRVIKTDALTVGATSRLDMNDNDMVVVSGSLSTIAARIASARNSGSWNGPGITSTAAKNHPQQSTTLGAISGADYRSVNPAAFGPYTVSPTDAAVVKYTWYGDSDLSGVVDFDDYVRIDNGFNTGSSGWFNGDFDFSGVVDFDDYVLIDLGFNTQTGTLRMAVNYLSGDDRSFDMNSTPATKKVLEHYEEFGLGYARGFLSSVPEPGAVGAVAMAGLAALRRRRRAVA